MIKQDIKIATDMLVFSHSEQGLQVLMVTRKNDPYKGMWLFPGGFVEDGETLEACAIRELQEETGIKLDKMVQLYVFDAIDRDPRGRTISIAHYAIVDAKQCQPKAADDAADAQWMLVKDLKKLAFDHNNELSVALQKLDKELNIPA